PFVRQVQSACDQAKYAAAYLAGRQPPSHPDTEQTFAELRQRVQKCLAFLETVQAKDLAGAEERKVSPPWLGGKWLRGDDYLVHIARPAGGRSIPARGRHERLLAPLFELRLRERAGRQVLR